MKKLPFTKGLQQITIALLVALAILREITECISHVKDILFIICNAIENASR
ncbi:hypothetical protein [Bacteroides xylanisolvens]|uniref:hypothetical protein n=1 Tax=Bacteroides xylanisolvens TaxID=371601 RepID=UPI00374F3C5D